MVKSFHNQLRQKGLIFVIIFSALAGFLIYNNSYYYDYNYAYVLRFYHQPREVIVPPQVYVSSGILEVADTLLVRVENVSSIDVVTGEFRSQKIDFFKVAFSDSLFAILGINVKDESGVGSLVINFSDGNKIEREIDVIEREFKVTEIVVTKELEEEGYTPSNIVEDITVSSGVTIKEVLKIYTPKSYFDKPFIYPLEKIVNVGAFGNIRKSGSSAFQHLGVDLDADIGTPVYAANSGVVRLSEELTIFGKTLMIDHGLGIYSLYLHLNELEVFLGEEVDRGQPIALSGNTGYSIDPHLHFSVKIKEKSVDPLRFIETTQGIDLP